MGNLFNHDTSIPEAQRILETFFSDSSFDHEVVSYVPMTYDDTWHMINQFKNIRDDVIDEYSKIKLAIICTWIFANKYNISIEDTMFNVKSKMKKVPQHHFKFYMDLLGSTFEEFGISTYGLNYYDLEDIYKIIHMHASNE